jgi:hypothetical protein
VIVEFELNALQLASLAKVVDKSGQSLLVRHRASVIALLREPALEGSSDPKGSFLRTKEVDGITGRHACVLLRQPCRS